MPIFEVFDIGELEYGWLSFVEFIVDVCVVGVVVAFNVLNIVSGY